MEISVLVASHLVGAAIGRHFIIPGLAIVGCWWWAESVLKNPPLSRAVPLVAFAGGQFAFLAAGALLVLVSGELDLLSLVVPDLVILAIGLVWLFERPTRAPAIFLLVYEALGAISAVAALVSVGPSAMIFTHLVVWVLGFGVACYAIGELAPQRNRNASIPHQAPHGPAFLSR